MTTRSLADIEKELLAKVSEKIHAEAKAIHDKEKATEHVRKFVEENGGVKATIALIQAAYGKMKVSKKSGGTRTRHTMTEEDEAKIAKLFKEGKKSGRDCRDYRRQYPNHQPSQKGVGIDQGTRQEKIIYRFPQSTRQKWRAFLCPLITLPALITSETRDAVFFKDIFKTILMDGAAFRRDGGFFCLL